MQQRAGMSWRMLAAVSGFLLFLSLWGFTGDPSNISAQIPEQKTGPAEALARLREGNRRFREGEMQHRDFRKQVQETASGQHPFASVVTCIDSRTSPELIFDQGIGDIFSARVAGNVVNEDILGSLEFASKVVGSRLIVVMGHTHCGAVKGAMDNVKMGNLTGLLAKIQPAADSILRGRDQRRPMNDIDAAAEMNVRLALAKIRKESPVLVEMIDAGTIQLVGAMYDIETGSVAFLDSVGGRH